MVDGKSWKMVEKNWRNGRYRNFGEMEQETGSDWWSWLRPIDYFMLIEFNRKIGFRRKYICRNWKSIGILRNCVTRFSNYCFSLYHVILYNKNKMPNHCNSLMLQFSYICHVAMYLVKSLTVEYHVCRQGAGRHGRRWEGPMRRHTGELSQR